MNFAYILSQKFSEVLSQKIVSRYVKISEKIDSLKNSLNAYANILADSFAISHHGLDFDEELKIQKKNYDDVKSKFSPIEETVTRRIKDRTLSERFGLISYFCALYCVLHLSLIGFADYFSTPYVLTKAILVFNIFALVFLTILIVKDNTPKTFMVRWCNWTHTTIISSFIIIFIIAWIYYEWFSGNLLDDNYYDAVTNFSIITSFLIPALHFVVYFVIATFYSLFDFRILGKDVSTLDKEFSEFKSEVDKFNEMQQKLKNKLEKSEATEKTQSV